MFKDTVISSRVLAACNLECVTLTMFKPSYIITILETRFF